nr:hypothetical protein [Halomonas sp. N3-2A]
MKLLHLLRRAALETNGATVGAAGRLAIDRLGDRQGVAFVPVEQPGMASRRLVTHRLTGAEHAQHRVVEALGALDVVGTDHDVVEHVFSLLSLRHGAGLFVVGPSPGIDPVDMRLYRVKGQRAIRCCHFLFVL